jgi:hypothetical protein
MRFRNGSCEVMRPLCKLRAAGNMPAAASRMLALPVYLRHQRFLVYVLGRNLLALCPNEFSLARCALPSRSPRFSRYSGGLE